MERRISLINYSFNIYQFSLLHDTQKVLRISSPSLPPRHINISCTSQHHSFLAHDTASRQFKRITVDTTEVTIRIPVVLPVADFLYWKDLMVQYFSRQIKQLAKTEPFCGWGSNYNCNVVFRL